MATVEVTFTPLPAHVRTARLVATAVARRSGVDESLLDEVRLAVGEACSRAVEAHQRHCPAEPVRIEMTNQDQRFVVTVSDHAPTGPARPAAPATDNGIHDRAGPDGAGHDGAGHEGAGQDSAGHHDTGRDGTGHDSIGYEAIGHDGGSAFPAGFGLAVISGLAEDVRVLSTSSGVSVRMSWPSTAAAS
ncbi:MAG TPA: ATP-binding protein [Streptosporangiaceae bacterium]|nr:ATP-binding protein [Streptosporangiaceae bacterium]